jgi:hypothetical protein
MIRMISTRTITLALAIAAIMLVFAASGLVAAHQAQAFRGFHRGFGNDDTQGNDNSGGNQNTGGNENR